ncbi:cytochrome P450 [Streptomyces zinciresistens K42]|uniref:Cytochrome P450 n=1 Tax=Streptomyces zinciresistens K42 TaxID=700597 RepID=G2G7I1_9ACTN|nr:P450-derived glycosyltransferase activator [Streptomyces zinciresistens]EGX60551.1 cytochrome P450 [Streptomyces zinciresistens K42]
MLTEQTNSELGRHLLTIRGVQFIFGAQGDPFARILRAGDDDPLSHGERAREQGLHESASGAWVTASHTLGARILDDPRFSARHPEEGPQHHPGVDVWENPLLCHVVPVDDARLNLEPAAYERLARIAAPLLGAGALADRAADVERVYREAVAAADARFDLYRDVAVPAALTVVAELLGLPPGGRERIAELHVGLATAFDAGHCPQQLPVARAFLEAETALSDELASLVASDRASGLVGLAGADPQDAVTIGVLAVVVGVEATATAVCNAVETLLAHPAQWERLTRDPSFAAAAVREALRLAPPLRFESRIARESVEFDGQTVEEGRRIVVLVDAANRDPEVFPEPDAFDPERPEGRSLTRTGGPADAVTANLVRMQTEAAVRVLAERRPALQIGAEVLRRARSAVLRGVLRFPAA